MATTGQLLRAARAACGFTQRRVADHLGLLRSGIEVSNWERGKVQPTEEELRRLAEVLHTTPAALRGNGVPEAPEPRRLGRPPLPPEKRKKNYRSQLTLEGPIPDWIGYVDLKALIRQYRGRMYDERQFKVWVERGHDVFGKCPSRLDGLASGTAHQGVRRRVYSWPLVKAWILSTLIDTDSPAAVNQ